MATLTARVHLGAALLDLEHQFWYKRVDLDDFDMALCRYDVMAYVTNKASTIDYNYYDEYHNVGLVDEDYEALTRAWSIEIWDRHRHEETG